MNLHGRESYGERDGPKFSGGAACVVKLFLIHIKEDNLVSVKKQYILQVTNNDSTKQSICKQINTSETTKTNGNQGHCAENVWLDNSPVKGQRTEHRSGTGTQTHKLH